MRPPCTSMERARYGTDADLAHTGARISVSILSRIHGSGHASLRAAAVLTAGL
jgi:hypothetical protein